MGYRQYPATSGIFIEPQKEYMRATLNSACSQLAAVALLFLLGDRTLADAPWTEPYFQYRLPITLMSDKPGWQRIPLDEHSITYAINRRTSMKFDSRFFAFNYIRVVEVGDKGRKLRTVSDAGFYLSELGGELCPDATRGKEPTTFANVVPGEFHLMKFTSSAGGKCPALYYETIFPPGSRLRRNNYRISYFPPLLPLAPQDHEVLFVPDDQKMKVLMRGRFIGKIHRLSVKRAQIRFQAKLDRSGKHRWLVYYQPMGSHHLQIPRRRRSKLPQLAARIKQLGGAERRYGDTRYRLVNERNWQLDYAATTVKLLAQEPQWKLPVRRQVVVTAAANEAESFQIVLRAQRKLTVKAAAIGGLPFGTRLQRVGFVPISRSSYITPARALGRMGDPLLPLKMPVDVDAREPLAFFCTIHVPPATKRGTYKGNFWLRTTLGEVRIPLHVKVHGFQLPHHSAFKANMGGQYIAKRLAPGNAKSVLDYHGLKTIAHGQKLARRYYDAMVSYKFFPKNAGMFADMTYDWSPPAKGYNVDQPRNMFSVGKFQLTAFNRALKHHVDRGLNSICLVHTNPTRSHIFIHLPGKKLDRLTRSSPHTALGWQSMRKMTFVGYGIKGKGPFHKSAIEVTQKQWDDLVLKFYRRMAENLDRNGWLDKTHILIDETENATRLAHLLRLLKSDPLVAKIQTVACIQGLGLLHHRKKGQREYTFHKILDTYCPEIDENYDRWMPYFFSDYGLKKDRRRLWCYLVTSSRLAIDTPGINNRQIALDVFNRGGSGLLIWETFGWHHYYGKSKNPWRDPYTRHANGSLAYFYPPSRTGPSKQPTFTITPSLRLSSFRDSVDDYDYAYLLEQRVQRAIRQGKPATSAQRALADIRRFFASNTHWSQNDAWYLELRERLAGEIEKLE